MAVVIDFSRVVAHSCRGGRSLTVSKIDCSLTILTDFDLSLVERGVGVGDEAFPSWCCNIASVCAFANITKRESQATRTATLYETDPLEQRRQDQSLSPLGQVSCYNIIYSSRIVDLNIHWQYVHS